MKDEEYLAHIESAILQIKAHTAGMTQEAYEADSKTQRAVERNLQIVGDAAHKLSDGLKQANPEIPWDDVYAARNLVVHFYFGVNQKILWDILQEDLDPLLQKVQHLSSRELARWVASQWSWMHEMGPAPRARPISSREGPTSARSWSLSGTKASGAPCSTRG